MDAEGPSVDLDMLLRRMVEVARASGARAAGIHVAAGPVGQRFIRAGAGDPLPDSRAGRAILAALAREQGPVRIDPSGAPATGIAASLAAEGDPAAFLGVPIRHEGISLGALYLTGKDGGFTRDDEALALGLARLAGAAIAAAPAPEVPAEFVSMISHELRTPIASIRGFGVLLRDRPDALSEDERREFVEAIVRQADSLSSLIGDVLDVSQMVTGRFHYAAISYDMDALLRECVSDAAAAHPSHEISLDAGSLPIMRGDPDRLRQVILNVLANACRFSEPGTEVRVRARAGDTDVAVSVTDQGVGIEAADLPRLFQRFERLHRDRLPGVKGTGLGLFIARQIVEAHGGRIWAESEPGTGSTFSFVVPVRSEFG